MANVEIKSLFHEDRFPSGWSLVLFLLYLPFGILLAFVRILIFVQACLLASALSEFPGLKSYIVVCVRQALGIIVHEEGLDNKSSLARIFVSNHVTRYDQIPLHVATGCVTPHSWELPSCFDWALGVKDLCLKQGRDMLIPAVRSHLNKDPQPVIFHPEGAYTTGTTGLLRFSTWPFSIITSVQPVAVTVRRPVFADAAPSIIGSSHVTDLLWFMCVPYTVYTIKYLPLMQKEEDENDVLFSMRVSKSLAERLGLALTCYTSADKAEFERRYVMELYSTGNRPVTRVDPVVQAMSQQVADVLPDVPLDVILKDVGRTHSVDATIANILDGVVQYTPLQTPRVPAPGPAPPVVTPTAFENILQYSFPKSAEDRMVSFQVRKVRLIEKARQKYMEKHNITMADVADFAC